MFSKLVSCSPVVVIVYLSREFQKIITGTPKVYPRSDAI